MTTVQPLRVLIADDERPARRFLASLLNECAGVVVVGEAASGDEAVEMIERLGPDLALLDLQMPEGGGLDVVRRLPAEQLPLVAFVTAFDDHAIEAFEVNAIDYVLKPAEQERVRTTVERARARLAGRETPQARATSLQHAVAEYERTERPAYLERVPVRRRDEVLLLPVRQIAFVTSDAELLHITTIANEQYAITHRLHLLEARLDPRRFIRLNRGTLANLDYITRVSPMPGGTYTVILSNGHELPVSRIQSRVLRDTLLKL